MNLPPPGGPPPGPPGPRQRRRAKIIVGIALPVLAGLTIAVIALSPGASAPTGEWKAGQCVTPAGRVGDQEGAIFRRTGCDAKAAAAKVTKMTVSGISDAQVPCPEDTDTIVKVEQEHLDRTGDFACVRNLKAPHPGDVGQGGGLFRPGDCILDPAQDITVKETPCAGAHWATVVRWADDFTSCPKGGSYDDVPMFASRRALCVRKG